MLCIYESPHENTIHISAATSYSVRRNATGKHRTNQCLFESLARHATHPPGRWAGRGSRKRSILHKPAAGSEARLQTLADDVILESLNRFSSSFSLALSRHHLTPSPPYPFPQSYTPRPTPLPTAHLPHPYVGSIRIHGYSPRRNHHHHHDRSSSSHDDDDIRTPYFG